MIHSREVVSNTGKVKDIDDEGILTYRMQLKCDECNTVWGTSVDNWRRKKIKNAHNGLDLCKLCLKKGSRNPSYGKDRSEVMAYARKFQKVNGMSGRHHTPETRALQSKRKVDLIAEGKFNIKSCNRGRKAFYVSTKSGIQFYADSILELARMIELDNDASVTEWTKHHGIRIPYVFDSVNYNYVPDFLIKNEKGSIIEEVKGRMIPRDIEKQQQAIVYCQQNGYEYRMVTGNDLQDLANYKKLLKETKKC